MRTFHRAHWWPAALWVTALLALLIATRVTLAPRYMYYFDNINFALALEDFNPARHQPQPPGYPLFVAVVRAIHLLIASPHDAQLIAGLGGAALSLWMIYALGTAMFSRRAGLMAALLLLFNPVFWLAGITHQVRVFLAAGATIVTLAAWRASAPGSPVRWFYASAGLLGVAAGFRPMLLLFLFPLLVAVGFRSGRRAKEWAMAFACLAATTIPWLLATIAAAGGFPAYIDALRTYSVEQFHGTSLIFGAAGASAKRMAMMAFVWNGLGILPWIWILPAIWKSLRWEWRAQFLIIRFVPAYLFHSLIHVGDPDHTIVTATVICLVGGAAIDEFARGGTRRWLAPAASIAISCWLFFHPFKGIAHAASFPMVRDIDQATRRAFEAVEHAGNRDDFVVVTRQSTVTWRHFAYYYQDVSIIAILSDEPGAALCVRGSTVSECQMESSAIRLPERRVLLLDRQAPPKLLRLSPGEKLCLGPAHLVAPKN